jgi:hypothetical protein
VTSLRSVARQGRQEPRVLLRPRFDSEDDAQDAIGLIASCGQDLDPFQVLLVCITLATLSGKLSASEVGALVARQNGKGGWLEAIAIWSLFEPYLYGELEGRKNTTMWTAHELKTSDDAYARVKALIQNNPDLAAEVLIWNGGLTGTHIIELKDGSRLIFLARSKSSGRGFSPRRVIFDEAQEFSALAFRAMMYATSAQGARRQLIYAGTVPSVENDSAIWTGVRDRGRSGKVTKLAWAEWTPEGSDDPRVVIDPTDWAARAWSNPALGGRILADTIDEEWEAAQADLEGFLRERLSVWPSTDTGSSIFPVWATLAKPPPEPPVVLALGIATDRDQTSLSLGSVIQGLEHPLLAISDRRPSTERKAFAANVARIQRERGCEVLIRGKNFIISDLEEAGVALRLVDSFERAQAHADLATAIEGGEVEHGDYPELNLAVSVASWRATQTGRSLDSKRDISALDAVALALHGAESSLTYDPLASVL